jgi:hypothetical protein
LNGAETEVDEEVSAWFREYQFRKVFSITHEDFLEQPIEVTDWLNDIDRIVNEVEVEQVNRQTRNTQRPR